MSEAAELDRLRQKVADAGKAGAALQRIVDALATHPKLESFVPAALRIVADGFAAKDCAFYAGGPDGSIRLRYWFRDGTVLGPEDIRAMADDHPFAAVKALEAGFAVSDSYLGMKFRDCRKPLVLKHGWDRLEASWEHIRARLSWHAVLYAPVLIDGFADGSLVINRGRYATYSAADIDLAELLAQHMALAIGIDRLTSGAQLAADSKTREQAARIQMDEILQTDQALQQTTDALAAMPDLGNFVPAVLNIVATTFKAKDCAYYEHRHGEVIRLKYWFYGDRVLGPEEIAALSDERDAFMRALSVDGFTVPDSYLGTPFRQRTKASVLDHTRNDPPTIFDEHCNKRGWQRELNVPLVVKGEADGALIINRPLESPFSAREVSLAERLGQQLALAMAASQLAAAAKDAAVERERERAERERSAEQSRHADILKETIDSLVGEEDLLGFIGRLLSVVAKQLEAPVTEYWANDSTARTRLVLTCRDGVIHQGSDSPNDPRANGVEIAPTFRWAGRPLHQPNHVVADMLDEAYPKLSLTEIGLDLNEWCRQRAVRFIIAVPLVRDSYEHGALCIYLAAERNLSSAKLDLAFSIGQQISLAVRMIELAEASKQSALSREREAAANSKASELTRANALIRSALERLSGEHELATFPRSILQMAMHQSGAQDGVIFVLDNESGLLSASDRIEGPEMPAGSTFCYAGPFESDAVPVWSSVMAARGPVVYDMRIDGHMMSTAAVDWHRSRGNRTLVFIPMFIGGELYGYFAMGLRQPADGITKVDVELMQALTQQATLAIQLSRLAEQSKQAALAQQREAAAEDRATELSNANAVLRACLERLSGEQELGSFKRTILEEAVKHTDARDGLILVLDEDSDSLTAADYVNTDGAPMNNAFARPFPASGTPAWTALVTSRVPVVFDVERDAAMLLPGLAAWHRSRGNRSIIAVAMFVGAQPYGYFGVTQREPAAEVSSVKIGLIHALSQQATLAVQLTRLAEATQQSAILVERQQVVVQERANMARDIHDRLAQGYAAILMQQYMMRRSLPREPVHGTAAASMLDRLDIIERLSRDNLADARSTMDELRLDPFGPGDLATSLRHCVDRLSHGGDFTVSLQLDEALPKQRRYVEMELCRIVSEAVTNARRHARCSAAQVSATEVDGGLLIVVSDDGVGFDVEATVPGFGLAGMHERAARAGARLAVVSTEGRGTAVQVRLVP